MSLCDSDAEQGRSDEALKSSDDVFAVIGTGVFHIRVRAWLHCLALVTVVAQLFILCGLGYFVEGRKFLFQTRLPLTRVFAVDTGVLFVVLSILKDEWKLTDWCVYMTMCS